MTNPHRSDYDPDCVGHSSEPIPAILSVSEPFLEALPLARPKLPVRIRHVTICKSLMI